jgi:protein-L-isoaspartate(D-aspartate) O-methyltransferase
MTEDEFAPLRQLMVSEIVQHTIYLSARLGKAALDRRVIEVMGELPRHAFVRLELQPLAYAARRCPAGTARPSPSPSSWR